jgi:hypothetical protein
MHPPAAAVADRGAHRILGALSALVASIALLAPFAAMGAAATQSSTLRLVADDVRLQGDWHVNVADLPPALELDADGDGTFTWPELEPRRADLEAELRRSLALRADGDTLPLRLTKLSYGTRGGEAFLAAHVEARAAREFARLEVDYSLVPDAARPADVRVVWMGTGAQRWSAAAPGTREFARAATSGGFPEFLRQGVWHIWIGLDHVLFLLVLLIPAVFRRTAAGREPVPTLREAALRVGVIVTAFTVAHSITLTAAAFGWIVLPSRLVESAIAASVFVAALLNFLPHTAGFRGAWIAFAFGLLHGFGFAGVLGELETAGAPAWLTLLAFNLGVELGQLAIVAVFLPAAFAIRHTRVYRTGVVYGGSSVAAACALVWFYGRAF